MNTTHNPSPLIIPPFYPYYNEINESPRASNIYRGPTGPIKPFDLSITYPPIIQRRPVSIDLEETTYYDDTPLFTEEFAAGFTSEPAYKKIHKINTNIIWTENNELLQKSFECPICYEDILKIDMINTNCNHSFCKECISQHINIKKDCPICRENINNLTMYDIDTLCYIQSTCHL